MLFTNVHGKQVPVTGKILFLGDSITDMGMYVSYIQAYLDMFQPGNDLKLYNLGLSAETVCGLTEPGHPYPRPDVNERVDRAMLTIEPRWVVVMYGMNDAIYHPFSEERFEAYRAGMWKLVRRIQEYGPRIILMTPTPFEPQVRPEGLVEGAEGPFSFDHACAAYDSVLERYSRFLLDEVAPEVDVTVDVHQALAGSGPYTEDGVHPGWAGHFQIAKAFMRKVFHVYADHLDEAVPKELMDRIYRRDQLLHQFYLEAVGYIRPDHTEVDTFERTMMKYQGFNRKVAEYLDEHTELWEPRVSEWHGFRREDFYYRGYEGVVVLPDPEEAHGGWIWKMEFFEGDTPPEKVLVEQGFALAYYRVSDQYGSPDVLKYMESFYYYVRERYGLKQQMIPIGVSRGGLYAMALAHAYPSWIRAMYLDAPAVDILSWPKEDSAPDWEDCKAVWGYTEETAEQFRQVVAERIETMVLAQIPLVLVYGDADTVVPYNDNGRLLEQAYTEAEAPSLFIGKKGCGHHPHSLEDPTPIVDFLTQTEDLGMPLSSYVDRKSFRKF